MAVKFKLIDNLDVIYSENKKLHNIEETIAAVLDSKGIGSYFAHNVVFYPESSEIHIGVYECGLKQEEHYIRKADLVIITTKPKIKTHVLSKNSYTNLDPKLRESIVDWSQALKQL